MTSAIFISHRLYVYIISPTIANSGDYQTADFSDFEDTDDEKEGNRVRRAQTQSRRTSGGKRLKECPGCSAMLPLPTKECVYCDYAFTSKSMLVSAQSANAESFFIQNKFPFEPERVS
jgi:hypothetical protein